MSAQPSGGYALSPRSIPAFPSSGTWPDELRWVVAVVDHDDDALGFVSSLLSYALDHGGQLTERQARYARRQIDRVRALYLAELLAFQQPRASAESNDNYAKGR